MSARLRRGCAALAAGGLLAAPCAALALWEDRLELFAAHSVTHDDNVFRLSSGLGPATALGASSKADTYTTTSIGFNADVPVSQQRFQARLAWNSTRYRRFSVLDLDNGHDARAAWLWQAGSELSGQLGYTDALGLASLANTGGGVLAATPNILRTQHAFFHAAYQPAPRWQLRAGASRLEQSNRAAAFQANDVTVDGADLGFSHVTPANDQIGLSTAVEEGRLPNRQLVAGNPVDNSYRQLRAGALASWAFAGHSRLSARAGGVSRSYRELPQRDFERGTYNTTWDWQATGKLALNTILQRDVAPLDDVYARAVLLEGIAFRPVLRLTEKASLTGELARSDREYLGDPEVALGVTPSRNDRVRKAALTVSYRPLRTVTLQAAAYRETRSSSAANGDYVANVVSLGARIGF